MSPDAVERLRAKIQTEIIIQRLMGVIKGEIKMEPHAVAAAIGLLRKVVPDLSATEIKTEVTHNYVIRMPIRPENMQEWQKKYAQKTIETTVQ